MGQSKEEYLRRQGMSHALDVARKSGVDGLEKECKMRFATNLPIGVSKKDLNETVMEMQDSCYKTILLMMSFVIHDKFGFGNKRLVKLHEYFEETAHMLSEGVMSWDDVVEIMRDECDIDYTIPDELRELSFENVRMRQEEISKKNK